MAKLRHIALSVPDPEKAADFYCEAFDMERVGKTDSPLARGCYVSDGTITMALLAYKSDEWSGYVEGEDDGKERTATHDDDKYCFWSLLLRGRTATSITIHFFLYENFMPIQLELRTKGHVT